MDIEINRLREEYTRDLLELKGEVKTLQEEISKLREEAINTKEHATK